MEVTGIITALISAVSAIVVALLARDYRKTTKEANRKAEIRRHESLLNLKMTEATLELSSVTAAALTGGHLNGNVEAAKKKAEEARQEYTAYAKKIMLEELTGG